MDIENKNEVEPALIPSDLQPSPPSKDASVHSIGSAEQDNEKKYEAIQTIKMVEVNSPKTPNKSMEKTTSVMASSLNLLPKVEADSKPKRKGLSIITKLGIIQLLLSLLCSAFGGLLIARGANLSWMFSGVWAGMFAGISGSLGLMNIQKLLNAFLACSLISVASSTLALAFTGIGLVRDFNLSQQNQEYEPAVFAAILLTFCLTLHLLTSMFSVYYSALQLCSSQDVYNENMNYEKFQNISLYLKSLQTAGVRDCDLNGYQNYINNAKLNRQRSYYQHPYVIQPIYAPISAVSSNYMPQMFTSHSYQSNFHEKSPRKSPREPRQKAPLDDSYMGEDREIADSYLKSMEARENHFNSIRK